MFPNAAKISLILVPLQSLEILMFHVSETNDSESDSEMPLEDEKRTGTKHFLKNLLWGYFTKGNNIPHEAMIG